MSRPDMGLRRMGIQLASQLPDSLEDALLVASRLVASAAENPTIPRKGVY